MLRQSAVRKLPLQKQLVGRNGCTYLIQKLLQSQEDSSSNVSLARYQSDPPFPELGTLTKISHNSCNYVLKRVSPDEFEQANRIRHELSDSRFIRLHVDENEAESTLIFPYFTEDLLSFLRHTSLPVDKTKRILCDILRGVKALHDKDWVYTGKLQVYSTGWDRFNV